MSAACRPAARTPHDAYAVDRKDWALYRTVFTDDAQLDYTSVPFGIAGPLDKVVAWLSQSLALNPLTMHYVTNVHTDVSETDALVRAQLFNPIQFPDTTK